MVLGKGKAMLYLLKGGLYPLVSGLRFSGVGFGVCGLC